MACCLPALHIRTEGVSEITFLIVIADIIIL
jgi:hypothetical protein